MTARQCGCVTSDRGIPTRYCAHIQELQARYRTATQRLAHSESIDSEEFVAASDELREAERLIYQHWHRR